MPPANPKLYHIVHHDKLPLIIGDGHLLSDASLLARGGPGGTTIGMGTIKERRLALPVECHPGLMLGQCVPFYFCPRSIMLYMIDRANHGDLAYRGGQGPIVHLVFDLADVVKWANDNSRRWAFTLSNAGSRYFEVRNRLEDLDEINWSAVEAWDWRQQDVKEGKQAEFLVEQQVPWELVETIKVISSGSAHSVIASIANAAHRPPVLVDKDCYY